MQASERDTPRVRRLPARWRKTCRHLDPKRLIFVDESGLNLALTRLYARAPRGVRAVGAVPQNYGQNLTVLAALDRNGMRAALLVPGATDGSVFRVFVEQILVPKLRGGDVMVLDNLGVHKVTGWLRRLPMPGHNYAICHRTRRITTPLNWPGARARGNCERREHARDPNCSAVCRQHCSRLLRRRLRLGFDMTDTAYTNLQRALAEVRHGITDFNFFEG